MHKDLDIKVLSINHSIAFYIDTNKKRVLVSAKKYPLKCPKLIFINLNYILYLVIHSKTKE